MLDFGQLIWSVAKISNVFSGFRFAGSHTADTKIAGFLNYGGRTSYRTVANALDWRLKLALAGFASVDAFPGDNGEIMVSGIEGDVEFEVIVEADGSASATLSVDEEPVRELSYVAFSQIDSMLQEATTRIWTSSGGLRLTSSTLAKTGSLASPSGNQTAMALCP